MTSADSLIVLIVENDPRMRTAKQRLWREREHGIS
jgi:hypothetical protein